MLACYSKTAATMTLQSLHAIAHMLAWHAQQHRLNCTWFERLRRCPQYGLMQTWKTLHHWSACHMA